MFVHQDWTTLDFNAHSRIIFFCVVVLLFFNWSFEALKWKVLMEKLSPLSFFRALKAVLAGLATGLITPNRIGNFIGRIAKLPKELKVKATVFTFYANLVQFGITICFGLIGVLFLSQFWTLTSALLLICIAGFGLVLSVILIAKPHLLAKKPLNLLMPSSILSSVQELREIDNRLKIKLIIFSSSRYFIFVIQYVLVLIALNQSVSYQVLFFGVTVMYLVMTIIPSLFFGKLLVREAAGLLIFGLIGLEDNVILFAGFFVWIINIAFPALVGTIGLLKK